MKHLRPTVWFCFFALTTGWLTLGVPGCNDSSQPSFPVLQSQDCAGGACAAVPPTVGLVGTSAGGGSGGGSGAAGVGGVGGGGLTAVSVNVNVINDPSFQATGPYAKAANVVAPTPASVVAGLWNGTAAVALGQVAVGKGWFSVSPLNDPTVLGTLSWLDVPATPNPYAVTLPVVRTDVLTTLLNQFATNATDPDLNAAHAVVTFVDASAKPMAGITVSLNLSAQTFYDGSDTKTGSQGTAYLLNIVGAGTTNTVLTYRTSAGAAPATTDLRLQNSTLSLLTVTTGT